MKRVVQMLLIVMFAIAPDGAAAKKRAEKPLPATLVSNERPAATAATAQISPEKKQANGDPSDGKAKGKPAKVGPPVEHQLKKAGGGRVFDLRKLPKTPPVPRREKPRPPKEQVLPDPVMIEPGQNTAATVESLGMRGPIATAAAPAPLITFEGLDRENWGAGSPPDTTGDVGPNWYIQAVNTSVGIYRKSDGVLEAGFTFDTLMSQGNFNNLCDTDNFGDPVVLYDTFEDRWILTDFAFATDAGGNVLAPAFQCFAVSMTGNPLTGGWNFYSIQVDDGLHDYEKLGVWTDGIYMSANMFSFGAGSSFRGARAWAINKFQMYAGSPTVQIVSFDIGTGDFTVVPSNARLQTGTPPPGRPNLFISTWNFLNGVSVYKFKVDWDSISLSTFTGPDVPLAGTSWPNAAVGNAPQPGTATLLDVLQIRAMVQNQYTNFGGVESLWVPHTVRRANTTGFATPRWYEVNVTGGAVAATLPQAATWDPDGANVTHRFMPSLAVDRAGNMLMAYSASSATTFPSILYAGRLASDPVNTFSQTEQSLLAGTASQTTSTRWGDYSSAMLDPDGCTFWITNQYANPVSQDSDKRWKTYIGAVRYPECTPVGAGGTISGTVTETPSGLPISGATVRMGVRTAVTNGSGAYTFTSIPAGTYSSIVASMPGYVTSSEASLVVNDGATTTQNFALALAPENACLVDTTQPDFQAGVLTNVSDTVTPGDLKLDRPLVTDQQNTTLGTQGAGFNTVTWLGQTFTAAVSGPVTRVDLNFFSLNCGAVTMPNVTVAIRNAAANLPTGADLATATVTGFCNGAGGWFTAHFATPFTVTAGTQYALVWRAAAAIPAGTPAPGYFGVVSAASGATAVQNPYAGGRRTSSSNSGATWAGATGNANNDHGFIVYVDQGYAPAGTFVSSTKDSNALAGLTPVWGDLTWNATTPANTTVRFQVAASNSINGPFDFVGPNGTAATYFTTSPAPMSQFFDSRYLQYKAYLDTTNTAVTPALHDVTLCYADTDCSGPAPAITPAAAAVCSSATGNTASAPAGMSSYAWSIVNGTITDGATSQTVTYTAGASGTVQLMLSVIEGNGCVKEATPVNVTINAIPATPAASNAGPFCENGTITLSTPLVSGATYAWTGPDGFTSSDRQPSISNATAAMAGAYLVTITVNGCTSAAGSTTVVVNAAPATPTASNGGPYCEGATIALSTPSVSGATYAWTGPGGFTSSDREPSRSNATVAMGGTYAVTITVDGCTSAAGNTNVVVNAAPATPTASNGGPYCDNATIVLSTPAVSGATYAWTGPNGFTSPDREPTRSNATPAMAGTYSVTVTVNGCTSLPGTTNVVVNSPQATPTASNGGPYCENATITLSTPVVVGAVYAWTGPNGFTSSDREPAISNAMLANAGTYSVTVTVGGCTSLPGTTNVVVNATPATPTISGATSFCPGGSVTLTSSSATGNQWYRNGVLQDGFTQQTYVASVAGDYTVTVTSGSCTSSPSLATTVVANAAPDATITVASTIAAGGSGTASVADAGVGATYAWVVGNGTITAGQGTRSINFTAGAAGALTIDVTVTSGASCSDAEQANVAVTVAPPAVNITTVVPGIASRLGGTPITINGTGFLTGATVTVGGIAATNVVVVNAVQITATTPAHAPGTVAVTVTNLDATTATLAGALVIAPQQFDANGDTTIDPSDIFYLVNYLLTGGPAPIGVAGVLSGDANGDSVVDPSDIFYLVNYLFASGPEPHATTPRTSVQAASAPFGGSLTLGTPYLRGNRWVVPVVFEPVAGGAVPQAVSLKVRMQSAVAPLAVRRAGAAAGAVPSFEISRIGAGELSYLVAFDQTRGALAIHGRTVIAEIELPRAASGRIELDPALTLVTDVTGTRKATEGNGALRLTGTTIAREPREERERPNLGRGGIR